MSKTKSQKIRAIDIIVILFCLAGAAYSFNLFRLDLFQTINSRNLEPVGTVTAKNNNVQRRLGERVLWGRLSKDSPVYVGDLIRVAENSGVRLDIADNTIELNENTLIRILLSPDGEIMLDLNMGSVSVVAVNGGSGIMINMMGSRVTALPGTSFSAVVEDDETVIQINEGSTVTLFLAEPELEAEPEPEPTAVAIVPPPPAQQPRPATPPPSRPTPQPTPQPAPQLTPQPAPVRLSEPARESQRPADGQRIEPDNLRANQRIDFNWSPVSGANAYEFTLSRKDTSGRRQVIRTEMLERTNWTLTDLSVLEHGTFIWQVEALNRNRDGTIERRGTVSENSFEVNIPVPKIPETINIEILYE